MPSDTQDLQAKIDALEAQRVLLGDIAVDAALAALRQERILPAVSTAGQRPLIKADSPAISEIVNSYAGASSAAAYRKVLVDYLGHILSTNHALNLRGIRSTDQLLSIELETVYVTLATTRPERQDQRDVDPSELRGEQSQPVQTLLADKQRLVILGDPGSGKTTLLRYLALTCARALAENQPELVAERLGLKAEIVPLPIFLPLREFAAFVRAGDARARVGGGAPSLLLDYLSSYFDRWQLGLPDGFFLPLLEAGHCLLLLDGLDEVANPDERAAVSEHVTDFMRRFPANRAVLTCRKRGYSGAAQLGPEFETFTVLDFTDEDIAQFVTNWTLAVEAALTGGQVDTTVRTQAAQQAAELQEAVLATERVRALAVNPLLLTVIAMVHRYRARLPENRADLYNECTEVLLGHWETAKPGEESKKLARYTGTGLEMDHGEKRAFIEPIAFAMQQQGLKELDKAELLTLLQQQFADRGESAAAARQMAGRFLDTLVLRSGLLQEIDVGIYRFLHLTFQEYLAARALADREDYAEFAAARAADDWWKEVILLAAGHLGTTGRKRVSRLVEALRDAPDDDAAGLLLAGDCLVDLGDRKVEAAVWQDTRTALVTLFEDPAAASLKARATAGISIGRIGDPRPGVVTLPPPLTEIVIQGDFLFGEDKPLQRRRTQPFRAGIYPITNGQYAQFMEAGGYNDRKYWSNDGWRWRTGEPFWDWQRTGQPDFWFNRRYNAPNQPVVGVTWYEAEAFCAWLTATFDQLYRLPTEEEWEHLARGSHGRTYPWGNRWEEGLCNTREAGLNQPNAVGLFATAASPSGAQECAGNVWEWCSDWTDSSKRFKRLKGGAWAWEKARAGCGARFSDYPDLSDYRLGFRVVAPIS